jgi:hypothetical protein
MAGVIELWAFDKLIGIFRKCVEDNSPLRHIHGRVRKEIVQKDLTLMVNLCDWKITNRCYTHVVELQTFTLVECSNRCEDSIISQNTDQNSQDKPDFSNLRAQPVASSIIPDKNALGNMLAVMLRVY